MVLFPILADPNPPSNLDGLDVSLSAGQMTALDGADSFTMTASTLTANGVPASWADIVDAVVNPAPTPTLQLVLNAGNSGSSADGGTSAFTLADGADSSGMSATQLDILTAGATTSMTAGIHSITEGDLSSVHSASGVTAVDNAGATLQSAMSASALSLLSDNISSTLTAESLSLANADPTKSATLNSTSLTVLGATSSATVMEDLVGVGYGLTNTTMLYDRVRVTGTTVSTNVIETGMTSGDATLNMSLVAPTDLNGQNALLTSSKSIRMTAEQNFCFSAGDDVVVYPRNAVITNSAGGSTDQYLSVIVNGIPYRISLLAQPTFPLRTISTINIGGGQNIFVQEPYIQWDYFTVSFTVSGWSGATNSSNFEILSYPTNAFQPDVSYSVRKVFINADGTYSFSVQNLTPERYNALQFFQTSANAFTVSSFTINGTQQIVAPNPVPLVCPPA
jgi:hypothetical protein